MSGSEPKRPPALPERRVAPRYEVIAQANLSSKDDVYLLTVRNISSSGVFLEGSPAEHPEIKPGLQMDLVLSFSSLVGEEIINIRCDGRVARVDPGDGAQRPAGFGLTVEPADADERKRLEDLLALLARR